jgi:hypothetical protein
MGTLGDGDGPESGPPEPLPDLPPDWGPIVVPDDPAELAAEAAQVRRELRRRNRRAGWHRLPPVPGTAGRPSLRTPALVLSITVLVTLVSLFAIARQAQQRALLTQRSTPSGGYGRTLPALEMVDERGGVASLTGLLPAVIIFVDNCGCTEMVEATADSSPPGVTVIALISGQSVPSPAAARTPVGAVVRRLADPASQLRGLLRLAPQPGTATALLVARSGEIVRLVPTATSIEDYRADLPGLASR